MASGSDLTAPPSLARGAALISLATAASRLTGFLRVIVVAAAMGTTFLANTYQTANTAPNLIFELVAAGVLTSVFVPTFVDYLVRGDREEGWDAANAMATVAAVALAALAAVLALAAPGVMRLLTLGVGDADLRAEEIALGSSFLRLFAPQVVFYGLGMVMTGALHAHRRFALPALAPIFNNLVVIAVYLTYAAMRGPGVPGVGEVTPAQTFVLGAGTTLGVVVMTVCLVPQLMRLGWRPRWRFAPSHPAVKKGLRVGAWALGYAGGYQAGLIVVLMLANRIEGGVAAYQWAFTFFYLPHALFAAPIFHVLFTAMSEQVAQRNEERFMGQLREGLGMLFFLLVPVAAFMVAVAHPLAHVTLEYGMMTGAGSALVARVLSAFALGLPAYSSFLVLTRAFYALGDVRTPALINAGTIATASIVGAVLFLLLGDAWAVPGLAAGHSVAFTVGAVVLALRLGSRAGPIASPALRSALGSSMLFGFAGLAAMAGARLLLPDATRAQAILSVLATGALGAAVYVAGMRASASPQLGRLAALARGVV